jgi:hypothetical protein
MIYISGNLTYEFNSLDELSILRKRAWYSHGIEFNLRVLVARASQRKVKTNFMYPG